eukprot:scaffold9109_cov19-Tisochrysis_lutea.AAC.4
MKQATAVLTVHVGTGFKPSSSSQHIPSLSLSQCFPCLPEANARRGHAGGLLFKKRWSKVDSMYPCAPGRAGGLFYKTMWSELDSISFPKPAMKSWHAVTARNPGARTSEIGRTREGVKTAQLQRPQQKTQTAAGSGAGQLAGRAGAGLLLVLKGAGRWGARGRQRRGSVRWASHGCMRVAAACGVRRCTRVYIRGLVRRTSLGCMRAGATCTFLMHLLEAIR